MEGGRGGRLGECHDACPAHRHPLPRPRRYATTRAGLQTHRTPGRTPVHWLDHQARRPPPAPPRQRVPHPLGQGDPPMVVTTTAAPTNDLKILLAVLKKLSNGDAKGWTAKRSDKGQWTVGTSRRNLRLSPPDAQWDNEKAREHLGKLRSAGLPYEIDEGREAPARQGIRNAHLTHDYDQPETAETETAETETAAE